MEIHLARVREPPHLAGQTILKLQARDNNILFATGGFTSPQIGYTEPAAQRGADKALQP